MYICDICIRLYINLGHQCSWLRSPFLGKPWRVDSWNTKVKSFVESRA